MSQLIIDFRPHAVHNVERLKGQSRRLYDYLMEGHTINVFDPAKRELRIGYLNSRISDLVEAGVDIYKNRIKVKDIEGDEVSVIEYSIKSLQT